MNIPKVSIIIPIYNAEEFLARCLESILHQSFTDWECILVDDGSPDGSGVICDEYVSRDERFKLIHKENGGVSSARNIGLDNAKGKWITFVDADDAIGECFLDISEAGIAFDLLIGIEKRNKGVNPNFAPRDGLYGDIALKQFFEQYLACHILRTPWGKFFKRDLVDSLRFDESLYLGEDTLFCLQYYQRCSKVKVDTSKEYLYTVTDANKKYTLDIDYILHTFTLLSSSYLLWSIKSTPFERFLYWWFYSFLENSPQESRKWYANKTVRHFYMTHLAPTFRSRLSYYKQWLETYL